MEKKNLDWGNLGFGYMTQTTVMLQITRMESGTMEHW